MKLTRVRVGFLATLGILLTLASLPSGQCSDLISAPSTAESQEIGIAEHLGSKLDLERLRFSDESGQVLPLSTYFRSGRPVLLTIVYYDCPSLCNLLLNGLVTGLKSLPWTPGSEFEIVTLSMNHREKPPLASRKKAAYLESYGRPQAAVGWHFLTGSEDQIRALAHQVGFGFKWIPNEEQYAHSAAIFFLTPDGGLVRYLYGVEYKPQDLKLALLEASKGDLGNTLDRALNLAYRFDPSTHRYTPRLMRIFGATGAGTMFVALAIFFVWFFWIRLRPSTSEPVERIEQS